MPKLTLSLLIAITIVGTGAALVNAAQERAFKQGRAVGKCDIVILLDQSMRSKDPQFAAPKGLIPRCKALVKDAERGLQQKGEAE